MYIHLDIKDYIQYQMFSDKARLHNLYMQMIMARNAWIVNKPISAYPR